MKLSAEDDIDELFQKSKRSKHGNKAITPTIWQIDRMV